MWMKQIRTIGMCLSVFFVTVMLVGCGGNKTKVVGGGEPDLPPLTLSWKNNMLEIHGQHIPGGKLSVLYLEAYCRAGSTDREWGKTVIGHKTRLLGAAGDGSWLSLVCELSDGVRVDHIISVEGDSVKFDVVAHNPTDKVSAAHWAQPCIRVGDFTGFNDPKKKYEYIQNCFVFLDGKAERLPTKNWVTTARYTPGQVWVPVGVPRDDVNPRPVSEDVLSNGLTGAVSGDGKLVMGVAWEPYQEIFQGVIYCIHSDFRIGGLRPGETKEIRGKIYLMKHNMDKLLARYEKDFPEHVGR